MVAQVLVLTLIFSGSALRVQHEAHDNANVTALSLSQQKEKLGSNEKLIPCDISRQNDALGNNNDVLSNYGTIQRWRVSGNKWPCLLQNYETQAPFYLDIATKNVLEARQWYDREYGTLPSVERQFREAGFGDASSWSAETKKTLNGLAGRVRKELHSLDAHGLELMGTIATNVYGEWNEEKRNPGGHFKASTGSKVDYQKCMYWFAEHAITPFETLSCLAEADPLHSQKHRHADAAMTLGVLHPMHSPQIISESGSTVDLLMGGTGGMGATYGMG